LSRKGLMHLLNVYTVWSSTYLAIRIVVDPANGFPPFIMGACRMLVAAVILLGIARLQGKLVRPTLSEAVSLFIAGNLLWLGGNGLVLWAEQWIDSGFACLVVSSSPIWVTIIELFIYRRKPSPTLIASLTVGFLGVAVLSLPSLGRGASTELFAVGALLLAAISWAAGSVFQARRPVSFSPQATSGYHHLAAGVGFLSASLALGEPVPHPTTAAWLSWWYLVIFGSVGAFTSYIFALRLLPINIAMTYAYVNPVLALFLGWLLLDEPLTVWTILGASLVIAGVFGVFRVKQQSVVPTVKTVTD
jgi:drug/metabolite transporter (DMT)-like permease